MSPLPTSTTDADAAAHQNAQTSREGGGTGTAPLPEPSREALSTGAQDALNLDDRMRELIQGKYADERAAFERL